MNPIKTMVVAIRVLAVRPWLWPTALRQLRNFAPDGWWRRAPFLPIPDRALLEFRGTTQYGDPSHAADAVDLPDSVGEDGIGSLVTEKTVDGVVG